MNKDTSWENSHKWYNATVGEKGHFYHQNIIEPFLKQRILFKAKNTSILDLGCGQGILSRIIPKTFSYTGVDISPSLLKEAKRQSKNTKDLFLLGDITKPISEIKVKFDYVCFILSIQNVKDQMSAIKYATTYLKEDGELILLMNHPCFRIPRQSSWQIDEEKKIQYRRIDSYLSFFEIPIKTHPSKDEKSEILFSYHFPLSSYFNWLSENKLKVENIFELISNKNSYGKNAKMENKARKEIPLFLALIAKK